MDPVVQLNGLHSLPAHLRLGGTLLAGSFLMFVVGLWDDMRNLRPATKLTYQLVGASLFIFAGGTFSLTGSTMLNHVVTYIWFVGIINAVNMLDNMDGLAAGVIVIGSITLGLLGGGVGAGGGNSLGVSLVVMLAAAVAGFWIFNNSPASIFMGDSGSLSIGYLVAGLAVPSPLNGYLGLSYSNDLLGHSSVLIIPVLVLSVPIYDTTLVTVTRMWRRQPISQGGCDHISHRLVRLGLSEPTAVRMLCLLSGTGCILAILFQRFPRHMSLLLLLFLSFLTVGGVHLGRVDVMGAHTARFPE